ncbi:molybdopterin-dependent oxidoreductase [Micromonospora sp. NPDC094482]|uniref:molybdopterin-dependent oxidoreductase n=1 Tax=unclassified Micromonospora TaxID=2617518 RepID=UPI00331EE25D
MTTAIGPRPAHGRPGPPPSIGLRAVVVGLLTAGTAVAVAHLAAGVLNPAADPVLAVGAAAIDLAPQPVKAFAIRTFGTADKLVLVAAVHVALAAASVIIGAAALRRRRYGVIGLAAFTVIGVVAVLTRPTAVAVDATPTIAGAVAGLLAMLALVRSAGTVAVSPTGRPRLLNRRQFLATSGATALNAAAAAATGQALGVNRGVGTRSRATVRIPAPASPAPPLPASVRADVDGVSPFHTTNRDFYRVDTALTVPQVDVDRWRLTLGGAVRRPRSWRFEELLARELIERDITLNCVSNEVGGPYIGTARWTGVPLAPLLREAGLEVGPDQLVSRSVDGMTIGTPLRAVLDGRDAMLVVAMNGEPLPLEHGFPVRMLVPGLYGYVGACKWLTELEVTTFAAYDAYWVRRGWAADAPVKTASRVDTPRPFARRPAGLVTIAGVAWAQRRGISAVEIQVDDEPWRQARLADGPSPDLWRQWSYRWDATPGSHTIRVRATDAAEATQTEERAAPFPSGATGWHNVTVTIT